MPAHIVYMHARTPLPPRMLVRFSLSLSLSLALSLALALALSLSWCMTHGVARAERRGRGSDANLVVKRQGGDSA